MELSVNITNDLLARLISSRGMIVRAQQRIRLPEALEAVRIIGTFSTPAFVLDDNNRFAYDNLLRWCISDPAMQCMGEDGQPVPGDLQKGIYLYGDTGTGKSLLLDICRTFCKIYKIGIKAGDQVSPLAWRTERADDICDAVGADGDLQQWKAEKVLCIQDLGNEPAEILYMGNRRRVLRSVIEARGDMYDRLTLISSNFPPSKLAPIYGNRVQSRIRQMCNPIYLGGNDRRK